MPDSVRPPRWTVGARHTTFLRMTNGEQILRGRRVLITDGDQRAALAIVRSLGAAGAVPFVCSSTGRSLAGASRYATTELRTADPLHDTEAFVEQIHEILHHHSIECLLPVTEAALRPLLRSGVSIGDTLLPFPPHDTFSAASDKRGLMELAERLSVPVPRQVVLTTPDASRLQTDGEFDYPLVLKPAASVASDRSDGRSVKLSVHHVADSTQFRDKLAELPAAAFPLLAQERIVGPGVGVFLLRWEGRILARFAHRRLREKPPSGGVSVYRESIVPPPDALAHAERLLEALDWEGVAMVEFKQEDSTGTPYLMEINGRFWGSLQLAIDAGVDFPRLLVESAFGHPPKQPVEGRAGIRLRWCLGDLDHLLLRLRKSTAELALEPGTSGGLTALASFFVPWRPGERWEVLRPSDPRPFSRELATWLLDALSSR